MSSTLKVRKHTTMEGFQGIAVWDLKYHFARDLKGHSHAADAPVH